MCELRLPGKRVLVKIKIKRRERLNVSGVGLCRTQKTSSERLSKKKNPVPAKLRLLLVKKTLSERLLLKRAIGKRLPVKKTFGE